MVAGSIMAGAVHTPGAYDLIARATIFPPKRVGGAGIGLLSVLWMEPTIQRIYTATAAEGMFSMPVLVKSPPFLLKKISAAHAAANRNSAVLLGDLRNRNENRINGPYFENGSSIIFMNL
jgi:hypothetical protein